MVGIGDFTQGPPLIALAGLLLIVTLLAWGFRGAILVGILCTAALGLLTGVIPLELAPEAWAGSQSLSFETFFALDFRPLLEHWREALLAIAIFYFLDLFDTVGTLVGVGMQAGYVDERGRMPGAGRAFFSDAAASCVGALFGTSTVTTYIESATGVAAGARTGLAPLVTAAGFLLALFFTPIIAIAGQDVAGPYYAAMGIEGGFVRMYPAVAPALIVVGFFMLAPLRRIQWDDITEAVPAFLTIAMMSFTFSISEGIAAGCVSYAAVKLTAGRAREVHPLMWLIAAALTAHYVFF
jgi:AGZA family xanthine/uracil permease-like MFS transporter